LMACHSSGSPARRSARKSGHVPGVWAARASRVADHRAPPRSSQSTPAARLAVPAEPQTTAWPCPVPATSEAARCRPAPHPPHNRQGAR
jgi:hypothetical protein